MQHKFEKPVSEKHNKISILLINRQLIFRIENVLYFFDSFLMDFGKPFSFFRHISCATTYATIGLSAFRGTLHISVALRD